MIPFLKSRDDSGSYSQLSILLINTFSTLVYSGQVNWAPWQSVCIFLLCGRGLRPRTKNGKNGSSALYCLWPIFHLPIATFRPCHGTSFFNITEHIGQASSSRLCRCPHRLLSMRMRRFLVRLSHSESRESFLFSAARTCPFPD